MLSLIRNESYFSRNLLIFFIGVFYFILACQCENYNINDPDCTGPFGTCTQEDKKRLGYAAVKKLHAKMDDDGDGGVEIEETKDFIKEDLNIKSGGNSDKERQKKFYDGDGDGTITVDEMWHSWEYSKAYNWTTKEMIAWLTEELNLPQYAQNFERNMIDGQFLPRLVSNENHYYSNVLQIKDFRHKRLMIIKATDVVLFGAPNKPSHWVKDLIMVGALTMSLVVSVYLYRQHRKSSKQIENMLAEFEKLSNIEPAEHIETSAPIDIDLYAKNNLQEKSLTDAITSDDNSAPVLNRRSSLDDGSDLQKLQEAEREIQKLSIEKKNLESRLQLISYQPPLSLIHLLNKTYEMERALLQFKLSMIEKEKAECIDGVNKMSKRQSGIMGALKIAHSSTLEDIQQKLEGLKVKHQKLKVEQQESTKRWNHIFEMCVRNNENASGHQSRSNSFEDSGSQDILYGSGNKDSNKKNNRLDEVKNKQTFFQRSNTTGSLCSYDRNDSSKTKYKTGDRVQNIKNSSKNSKVEFCLDSTDESLSNDTSNLGDKNQFNMKIANNNMNNNTDIYMNGNGNLYPNDTSSKLVIISPTNLPQQPSPQHSFNSMPNANGKISRESLIHGSTDIFQFSDVESVQTTNFFIRKTPQSSFESDDTYKSNSLMPSLIKSRNSKSGGQLPSSSATKTKEKKSFLRSSFTKLTKNDKFTSESLRSLEPNDKFSKTLNSLRSKIFSSNKNLFGSQTIKPVQTSESVNENIGMKPEIIVTPSVHSMVQLSSPNTKQLTIRNLNVDNNEELELKLSPNGSVSNLNISIPHSPNSNSSFTIQNKSNEENEFIQPSSPAITPTPTLKSEDEKKTNSIFTFKGKGKKSKSKSPKKKKT